MQGQDLDWLLGLQDSEWLYAAGRMGKLGSRALCAYSSHGLEARKVSGGDKALIVWKRPLEDAASCGVPMKVVCAPPQFIK